MNISGTFYSESLITFAQKLRGRVDDALPSLETVMAVLGDRRAAAISGHQRQQDTKGPTSLETEMWGPRLDRNRLGPM